MVILKCSSGFVKDANLRGSFKFRSDVQQDAGWKVEEHFLFSDKPYHRATVLVDANRFRMSIDSIL